MTWDRAQKWTPPQVSTLLEGVKLWDLWMEGYGATCENGTASCVARGIPGMTFTDACIEWARRQTMQEDGDAFLSFWNAEELSYWLCCLYPNEADARRSYG